MAPRRFFVEHAPDGAQELILAGAEAHHAVGVTRLREGGEIELRDGKGGAWTALIAAIEKNAVRVRVTGPREVRTESPLEITLGLAYSRPERMELVLRQATELGANRFAAFRAARSQYGLSDSRAAKREGRWLKIAREALCQCGRTVLPRIDLLPGLEEFLAGTGGGEPPVEAPPLKILALEGEKRSSLLSLRRRFPSPRRVVIATGPEGGWTGEEKSRLAGAGFLPAHLGPRILRFETAAAGFIAAVQLLWGDFGVSDGEPGAREE
jgi:16S rRNA (uracil1498-N3)-methyltransferase